MLEMGLGKGQSSTQLVFSCVRSLDGKHCLELVPPRRLQELTWFRIINEYVETHTVVQPVSQGGVGMIHTQGAFMSVNIAPERPTRSWPTSRLCSEQYHIQILEQSMLRAMFSTDSNREQKSPWTVGSQFYDFRCVL